MVDGFCTLEVMPQTWLPLGCFVYMGLLDIITVMKKELFNKINIIKNKGFTLIELLVVIAIIGILTAIISANFGTSKSKARDAKKISDIAQLQLTLELYFDRCNSYPATLDLSAGCGGGITLGTFISALPKDGGSNYIYALSGSDYVLMTTLENASSLPDNDLNGNFTGLSRSCNGLVYCVQSK